MIVAYVPDLMDRSKVSAAGEVTFVTRPADLAGHDGGDTTVIVDLSRPGVLEMLPTIGSARIIGFASHIDRDLMDRARAAGCTEVLPRSAFFGRLAEFMG